MVDVPQWAAPCSHPDRSGVRQCELPPGGLWRVADDQRQPLPIEPDLMDDRAGLIERAAALLHSSSDAGAPFNPQASVADAGPAPPLSRSVVLDRNHLAAIGVIMPWTATAQVVEEFRIVKRNIMFPWQSAEYLGVANRPPRVVMLPSSRPREGKTFCSINLALACAAGKDVST